jgi:hypothetical protein
VTDEPRTAGEYDARQVDAAHRVLVDLGQVLGGFQDCIVIVGGWVPDLLLRQPEEAHVGSIDVDLALDSSRLQDGRYAEILRSLLATRRYERVPDKAFKLRAKVEIDDGGPAVLVDVDFLKTQAVSRTRRAPIEPGFRPIDARVCARAFRDPVTVSLNGRMISGAENQVEVHVASIASFLVMKAFALAGRDKPKDAYDIAYVLDHVDRESLAIQWRGGQHDTDVDLALAYLKEKFATVDNYGPRQVADFYDAAAPEQRASHARRAFELVQDFIAIVEGRVA